MGKVLGLDIGITSVGFGIIEEGTNKIVKYGVRLFDERDAEKNVKRRTMRGSRRLKRRRGQRITDLKIFFENEGIIKISKFTPLDNVYEIRVKGLKQKLTNVELATALLNITKRRGSSLETVLDEKDEEGLGAKANLGKNEKTLKEKDLYVCELQLKRLNETQELRGNANIFKTKDYVKEARKILETQGKDNGFIKKVLSIIERRRHYSEGPGSEKSITPYGRYRKKGEPPIDLIEEMRGKCSIYPEELRAPKTSYSANLFNFLNDLNNLKINKEGEEERITKKQKNEIIKDYINEKGKITVGKLLKYLNIKEENIKGFRQDAKGKLLLTEFSGYQKVLKIEGLNKDFIKDKKNIDILMEILTSCSIITERQEKIRSKFNFLLKSEIEKLSVITGISQYHALSFKAIYNYIEELIDTTRNQMQINSIRGNIDRDIDFYKGRTNIPFDNNAILNPVAKRAHIQALKVVNELRKDYGEFSAVVIETARERNSKEQKNNYKVAQKRIQEIKDRAGAAISGEGYKGLINYKTRIKYSLYEDQECKCAYTGNIIDLKKLLTDSSMYEIDHIIPYSISFDDSYNNKVLVERTANQEKGNRSPAGYFRSGKAYGNIRSFTKFKIIVLGNKKYTRKKREYLLEEREISKYETRKDFINRNLVDTRYATKTIMNTIRKYYKANNIDTTVSTIRGAVTSTFRKRGGVKKDRDKYIHHAVDALIVASLRKQALFKEILCDKFLLNNDVIDEKTGEVLASENKPLEDNKLLRFISSLKSIEGKPSNFSYKVDRKTNRQFSNETIYSTRNVDGKEMLVMKYNDIYGDDGERLKKIFDKQKTDNLLMYHHDKKTYDILLKIYEEYKNEKNPFLSFKNEHGYIKKYSKKGNGPRIKGIKYYSGENFQYKDISHKYKQGKEKRKVVLTSINPYRIDFYKSKEGIYKFITIKIININNNKGKKYIDEKLYNSLLIEKGIDNNYNFMFSFNKNDIIRIIDNNEDKLWRFAGVVDNRNQIEIKKIIEKDEKRKRPVIGKKIKLIEKYNVSVTGKRYLVENEVLKLEL